MLIITPPDPLKLIPKVFGTLNVRVCGKVYQIFIPEIGKIIGHNHVSSSTE
jgi:hypothetical protein